MRILTEERRLKRSSDPLVALHYQLAVARNDAELEAIVVADPSGIVVAGAGTWPACEELAAYAPLLAQPEDAGPTISKRVEALRPDVAVLTVSVGGQEVLICARGGRRAEAVTKTAEGVVRILAEAA